MHLKTIAATLNCSELQVKNVIQLLNEGATIPFIARYRKEITNSLDEVKIEEIKTLFDTYEELDKRKTSILKTIEQQGQLTPELKNQINNANNIQDLEDIYLPYKQKRKTRASIAIEKGLEPLAKIIFAQNEKNIAFIAQKFVQKEVKNVTEAIAGARDIIAEWINENSKIKKAKTAKRKNLKIILSFLKI